MVNKKFSIKSQSGAVASILLVLVIIVVVAIGIAYMVTQKAQVKPVANNINTDNSVPLPVYDTTVSDVRFIFVEAVNLGSILSGKLTKNPDWVTDLNTTERFVRVVIAAQNIGTKNTDNGHWDIGNIIDEKGREFVPSLQSVTPWLPENNGCGEILQPSFEPTPCTKIYEVAKVSQSLKIRVSVSTNSKKDTGLVDLKLMK